MSVYDGRRFTALEGLPPRTVAAIAEDRDGHLWAATWGGGVWRWDDQGFAPLAAAGRTLYPLASSLVADRDGRLWVGTWGGGVYVYDGQVLQRLTRKDGLVHDGVQALFQDRRGDIWIATEGGVTRYRPGRLPPGVRLTDVIADQRYGPVGELEIPVSQKLVAFEFEGRSWTTRPEGMAYVYRLEGFDDRWRTTYGGRVEYRDLPLGDYTFQVRAVDRDLNYSDLAVVRLRVAPDPRLAAMTQALSGTAERFVGHSPALQQVQSYLTQVAGTDLTVLILGETGTGKGLAARTVHRLSPRAGGPLIPVNCGALPEGLVESELFGHEKGAFTGAVSRKLGKVELAQGGTLFLDEIGDLSSSAQAKLLRLLEERTFERVGGTQILRAEVRVVAATNRDLAGMVTAGQFRQDLYFRLQGFTVWLPPLRQRAEDIPELAVFFAGRMAAHLDKAVDGFAPTALARLKAYPWPGNVRELESAVQRAVIVAAGPILQVADLTLQAESAAAGLNDEALSLSPEEYERSYLLQVLAQTGWTIKGSRGAAARLGISPSTLHGRLKRLGIVRPSGHNALLAAGGHPPRQPGPRL
jgi:DNA-binding NtrC family response regulator